jgi:hypothetical protein
MMIRKLLPLLCAGIVFASVAAAMPTPGLYMSTDLGGQVLTGRGTNSWTMPLNGAQGLGDVFNSWSWNGSALGTQWIFQCGVSPAAQTVQDNRVAGTGTVVFTTSYTGGTFFLDRNGPWGTGVMDFTGTLNSTVNIVTVQYVNNVPFAAVTNVNSSGLFDGSNCALTFAIANGVGKGDTDLMPKPAGYPDFMDTGCAANRVYGSWGDLITITMLIDCPVPVEVSTWGRVKALYR